MNIKVIGTGCDKCDKLYDNTKLAWNYYNTGRKTIVNDRIYEMKGIIMVIEDEVKKNKIQDYKLAMNDTKYNNYK